jgi:hypothetical protein
VTSRRYCLLAAAHVACAPRSSRPGNGRAPSRRRNRRQLPRLCRRTRNSRHWKIRQRRLLTCSATEAATGTLSSPMSSALFTWLMNSPGAFRCARSSAIRSTAHGSRRRSPGSVVIRPVAGRPSTPRGERRHSCWPRRCSRESKRAEIDLFLRSQLMAPS